MNNINKEILKYRYLLTHELVKDLEKVMHPYNIYHYNIKGPYIKLINNNEATLVFNWDTQYNSNEDVNYFLNLISNYFTINGLTNRKTKRALIFECKELYSYLLIRKLRGEVRYYE